MKTNQHSTEQLQSLVVQNLGNPRQLERLYRDNRQSFTTVIDSLYLENSGNVILECWYERLHYSQNVSSRLFKGEFVFILVAVLIAGFVAKLPDFFGMDQEYFYSRYISFIVFPFLAMFFFLRQKVNVRLMVITFAVFCAGVLYAYLLPFDPENDTLVLVNIHLPLVLWSVTGLAFTGNGWQFFENRLSFLRYNGDLAVMSAILALSGALMAVITMGLFELIGVNLEDLYGRFLGYWALPAIPLIATGVVLTNPGLINRVSPMIAKIFTPLVLVMLVVYLISMASTGKDPYNDRQFLLLFNVLLIGVMALIVFSVSGHENDTPRLYARYILPSLCLVTLLVNGIALSAIVFRMAEWGITPNRAAVFGSNILIMVHLSLVTYHFFRAFHNPSGLERVRRTLADFLPVYAVWAVFVVLVFPLIFHISAD